MTRITLMILVAGGVLAATPLLAHSADPATNTTDQQITAQVRQELDANDPALAPAILVTTRDGVVTLSGVAMTQQDILTALQDAEAVGGVVRVENHLKLG